MLKITALLFNTFALLIYQLFFADVVTITQNIPATAKPGTEFTVEITVNKGSSGGFAKLQQELPVGFTAVEDKNNGASFTFVNQSVKFIWMSLPSDKEFKVSYKVNVAEGTTGAKILAGKFSYVSDNVKQTVEITPATITIGDEAKPAEIVQNPTITTPTETKPVIEQPQVKQPTITQPPVTPSPSKEEASKLATTFNNATGDQTTQTPQTTVTTDNGDQIVIEGSRKTITNSVSPGEFPVEITIKKGNLGGFAKYIETLPVGFTATLIEGKGAAFSFVDQKVKFVWGTLPSETEFKISYKVSVNPNVSDDQILEGTFSFINNNQTQKYVLLPTSIKIGKASAGQMAGNPKGSQSGNQSTEQTQTKQIAKQTEGETVKPSTREKQPKIADEMAANTIGKSQGKINYKVQVLALRREKSIDVVTSLLTITEPIELELHEGLRKYIVGSHAIYKEARDHREQIPKVVIVPWVVAYNGGRRTTVQDALMITSQKWYK
jgi:hypothetical protein